MDNNGKGNERVKVSNFNSFLAKQSMGNINKDLPSKAAKEAFKRPAYGVVSIK